MKFSTSAVLLFCWTSSITTDGYSVLVPRTTSFVPRTLGKSTFVSTNGRKTKSTTIPAKSSTTSTRSNRKHNTMIKLVETSGGMEELVELTEKIEKPILLNKQARKSPQLLKMVGVATIPVSAVIGFGLLGPTNVIGGQGTKFAVQALSAVVTGIAGAVGKSRLDAITLSNAKPAIAQALIDNGITNVQLTIDAINKIKNDFNINEEDFSLVCTEIYTSYLLGMIKYMPTTKTTEIKELDTIKSILQLTNIQIGEGHVEAAREWYRTTSIFTPDEELQKNDNKHPDRMSMDKLLFLTDRILKNNNETNEAYIFEMTRVAKAFHISYTTAIERIATIAEPFYIRALTSTRTKLHTDQVSTSMLQRARQTLGISDSIAKDYHISCFNQEVRSLLGLSTKSSLKEDDIDEDDNDEDEDKSEGEEEVIDYSNAKFTDEDAERLEKLQEILQLSNRDVDYEIALEAMPIYQQTVLQVMDDVIMKRKTSDVAWDIINERRSDLLLNEQNSKNLLSSMIMQSLGTPIEATNKFAKVNNEAATYDHIMDTLHAKDALVQILSKSGYDDFITNFDETFCNPWNKKSANGFLSSDERIKIYRIFLSRTILKSDSGIISDESYVRIKDVQGLLGITDQQHELEIRKTFGPKLQVTLREAMNEIVTDYTPELAGRMKTAIQDIVTNYRLSADYLRETGVSFYAKAVEIISNKAPGGIPTNDMAAALESLRDLYMLTKEETYPSHMEYFGSIYKKSVLEAMGQTGIIRAEFRTSLDELKNRLGVSEDNVKQLFLDAVEEKMEPLVKWVGGELERTMLTQQQLAKRRNKDMGEDVFQTGKGADGTLGLGAEINILSDIMELVDFYIENNIIEEIEVEKRINESEKETVTEKFYPITALGSSMIDQELAELLYRQLIVGSFTTQGPNAARYENARDTFAGILGLTTQKKDEIGNTIGSTVYDNYVSNAMKTKGTMDQQDMMFLATIQGKLGITPEESEKLMLQSQKKLLSEEIDTIMDNPTGDSIKGFREKCNSMGMNLQDDVGISKQRLIRMFECEIVPALKSGIVTATDSEMIGEIQESLGLDADEAETMFENVLVTLAKNGYTLAKGEIMRGREENAVSIIKDIIRYAAFTGGDLGLQTTSDMNASSMKNGAASTSSLMDETINNTIINIYESLDLSGEDKETIENNKELLKSALGL